MNYSYICIILLALILQCVCIPIDEDHVEHGHIRVKRFTCDVLGSIEAGPVKLNDAACAAHCLLKHKKGGWCDDHKECHCRD